MVGVTVTLDSLGSNKRHHDNLSAQLANLSITLPHLDQVRLARQSGQMPEEHQKPGPRAERLEADRLRKLVQSSELRSAFRGHGGHSTVWNS